MKSWDIQPQNREPSRGEKTRTEKFKSVDPTSEGAAGFTLLNAAPSTEPASAAENRKTEPNQAAAAGDRIAQQGCWPSYAAHEVNGQFTHSVSQPNRRIYNVIS
jgi:hypothetical protein